jgi:hypothetical protein
MTTFPSIISPDHPLEEYTYKGQLRTEFEAGYVLSRARATQSKTRWTLRWQKMPTSDYDTLRTFFITNIGSTFDWTYPTVTSHTLSGDTIDVRFVADTLHAKYVSHGFWEVSVELEEK